MNHEPLISIIVPVYNVEQYLRTCLDSLIYQTYHNLEIICVDDGSTDGSAEVLKQYAAMDARIVVISQENMGLSGARNSALEKAYGEFIMFVDGDDWIDADTCSILLEQALLYDVDLVLCSYVREYAAFSKPKYIFPYIENHLFDEEEAQDLIFRRCVGLVGKELSDPSHMDSIVTACVKLYRANLIQNNKVRFVDTKQIGTEDALFNIYCLINMKGAYYVHACKYHYRRDNENSLTSQYKKNLYEKWQNLYNYIERFISIQGLSERYSVALNNRIALSLIGLSLNILSSNNSYFWKKKEIKKILTTPRYRKAYWQLDFQYFPLHWKVFFACAKYRFATGVYWLSYCIKKIMHK